MRISCALVFVLLAASCSPGGLSQDDRTATAIAPTPCASGISAEISALQVTGQIPISEMMGYVADQGERFWIVTVLIANDTDIPVTVKANAFRLLDSNDRDYDWVLAGDFDELEGTANPRGTLRGTKVFSVPSSVTAARLTTLCGQMLDASID